MREIYIFINALTATQFIESMSTSIPLVQLHIALEMHSCCKNQNFNFQAQSQYFYGTLERLEWGNKRKMK